MIKFNGYPFLEKEDHVFNVPGPCVSLRGGSVQSLKQIIRPVARVMKRDLHTLPISDTIQDVETLLNGTVVNGFPIVTNDARQTLVGYIGRREVRYVIGTSLSTHASRWWVDGSVRKGQEGAGYPAGYTVFVCRRAPTRRRGYTVSEYARPSLGGTDGCDRG